MSPTPSPARSGTHVSLPREWRCLWLFAPSSDTDSTGIRALTALTVARTACHTFLLPDLISRSKTRGRKQEGQAASRQQQDNWRRRPAPPRHANDSVSNREWSARTHILPICQQGSLVSRRRLSLWARRRVPLVSLRGCRGRGFCTRNWNREHFVNTEFGLVMQNLKKSCRLLMFSFLC